MSDIEAAARRAERRIKAVSLQHHAHEDSAVLLHALLVDVPAAIEEEFMALRSALLARLARVEEALRFYADEGTYCLSHPAHGGYECCGGGDEGPIIEDRGSKARAALAKNAGNTPPPATGEAPPCGCDIDATRHDRSCPAYTGNAAPTPPPATGETKCEWCRGTGEIGPSDDRYVCPYCRENTVDPDPRRGEDGAAIDALCSYTKQNATRNEQ